jgi:hypothetical protein
VYCYNSRSRSPAFVAAYFVVVGCYSAARAYGHLSALFLNKRRVQDAAAGIDRCRRFRYYVDTLEKELIRATTALA